MTYRYFAILTTGEPVTGQVLADSIKDAECAATADVGFFTGGLGKIHTLRVTLVDEPYDWSGLVAVIKTLAFVGLVFLALYAGFWWAGKGLP